MQMDKFRQISTELWPLVDVINWFYTLYLWLFFFKNIAIDLWIVFEIKNISWRGMMHACSAFSSLTNNELFKCEIFTVFCAYCGYLKF